MPTIRSCAILTDYTGECRIVFDVAPDFRPFEVSELVEGMKRELIKVLKAVPPRGESTGITVEELPKRNNLKEVDTRGYTDASAYLKWLKKIGKSDQGGEE